MTIDIIGRKIQKIADYNLEKDPTALAFSPDGRYLAVGFNNGDVELWDGKNSELVKKLGKHIGIEPWSATITSFAYQRSNNLLISVAEPDTSIIVWDLNNLNLKKIITNDDKPSGILSVAFINNTSFFITGGGQLDYSVKVWDLENNKKVYNFPKFGFIKSIDVQNEYNYLLFCSSKKIYLYRLDSILTNVKDLIYQTDLKKIYPNPVTNKANIKIDFPTTELTKITITDKKSVKFLEIDKGYLATGLNTIEIDVSMLPAGMYFVNI